MSTNHVSEPVSKNPHPDPLTARSSTLRLDPKRVYSALVLLPLLYVLTRHLPPTAFFMLVMAAVLLAQWEFLVLFIEKSDLPSHALIGFTGTGLLLIAMQWPAVIDFSLVLAITLLGLLCYQVGFAPSGNRHLSMFILLFGILYIGYTLGHFLLLRNQQDGGLLVLFVLLVTWASDAAAYYVGKTWGARPLAPRLKPE